MRKVTQHEQDEQKARIPLREPGVPEQTPPGDMAGLLIVADIPSPNVFIIDDSLQFNPTSGKSSIVGRKIHGTCKLPVGYALSIVPMGAEVLPLQGIEEGGNELLNSQKFWKRAQMIPGEKQVSTFDVTST